MEAGGNRLGHARFQFGQLPLQKPKDCVFLHSHCDKILKPSTLKHIGEKLLQLAATNCTDGGSFNTRLASSRPTWTVYRCLTVTTCRIEGELVVAALLEPRRPEQAMVGQAVED